MDITKRCGVTREPNEGTPKSDPWLQAPFQETQMQKSLERTYTLIMQPHAGGDLIRLQFQADHDVKARIHARRTARKYDASIIKLMISISNYESNVDCRLEQHQN